MGMCPGYTVSTMIVAVVNMVHTGALMLAILLIIIGLEICEFHSEVVGPRGVRLHMVLENGRVDSVAIASITNS